MFFFTQFIAINVEYSTLIITNKKFSTKMKITVVAFPIKKSYTNNCGISPKRLKNMPLDADISLLTERCEFMPAAT